MTDSRPPPSSGDLGAQLADLRRLRRPRDDRMVAGVCAGLGRHLRVDPVVLRVVLAVMIFFGGTGVLLYAAGWLLIPNEDAADSVIERHLGRRPDGAPDKAVMIGGIVVLLLLVASLPWWGFSWHPGVLLLLAGIALFWLFRRRDADGTRAGLGPGTGPVPDSGIEGWIAGEQAGEPASPASPASDPVAEPTTGERPAGELPTVGSWRAAHPAPASFWDQPDPLGLETQTEPETVPLTEPAPPVRPTPPAPPAARPPRSKLFGVTAASALIVLGCIAVLDQTGVIGVSTAAYLAAMLFVVGLGLVAGAWVGRSPGLVISGIVLALALAPASVYDYVLANPDEFGRDVSLRPTTLAAAEGPFDYGAGQYTLDLRAVPFADGTVTSTSVDLGAGDLTVVLPPDVDVRIQGDTGVGDMDLLDRYAGGMGASMQVSDDGDDGAGGGLLKLEADVGAGTLEVRRG